jgi:cation:H+ antiporter
VIGTSALIVPIKYGSGFLFDGIIAILTGILLWLLVLPQGKLKRSGGILLLLGYAVYFVWII